MFSRFLLRRGVDWVLLVRAETHTHALIHKSYAFSYDGNHHGASPCQPFWMLAARIHVKTRIHIKTLEKWSLLGLVTKYYGHFDYTETWQNPGKIGVFRGISESTSILRQHVVKSLETTLFGAAKVLHINLCVCVFAGFIHLAPPSIVLVVDEQKSENNLQVSSFLTIDCRFLINCHLKTGKSTILGANQIMCIFAGFIHLAPPSIETSFCMMINVWKPWGGSKFHLPPITIINHY